MEEGTKVLEVADPAVQVSACHALHLMHTHQSCVGG